MNDEDEVCKKEVAPKPGIEIVATPLCIDKAININK